MSQLELSNVSSVSRLPCVPRCLRLLWCCRRDVRSSGVESACKQSFSMEGAEVSHETACLLMTGNMSARMKCFKFLGDHSFSLGGVR